MNKIVVKSILVGILAVATLQSSVATAEVVIDNQTICFSDAAVHTSLSAVLAEQAHLPSLSVAIVGRRGKDGDTVATMRMVSESGAVLSERVFRLNAEDCKSVVELFSVVLGSFLREFPIEAEIEPTVSPVTEPSDPAFLGMSGQGYVAVATRTSPGGGDMELGLSASLGGIHHRLAIGTALRIATPQSLAGGHFFESMGLLGVGWQYVAHSFSTKLEVRSGALRVTGYGFMDNRHSWLPWVEVQGTVLWTVGRFVIGPQFAYAPMQHDVVASPGVRGSIPQIRLGVTLGVPLLGREQQ